MYEDYNNEKQTTKWFIGYFYLRRLLFSICCVYLINYPVFQIQLYMAFSLANLIFIIIAKPFTTKKANYTEIYNEVTILAVSFVLFSFTDFVPNTSTRQVAGYFLIAIVLLNILYHLLTLLASNIISLFKLFSRFSKRLEVFVRNREKSNNERVGSNHQGVAKSQGQISEYA